jgi:hypothetical protein
LDSLFQRGKSGDKGEAYASDVAFLQKAFSFAFSVFFCPLRLSGKKYFTLHRWGEARGFDLITGCGSKDVRIVCLLAGIIAKGVICFV